MLVEALILLVGILAYFVVFVLIPALALYSIFSGIQYARNLNW